MGELRPQVTANLQSGKVLSQSQMGAEREFRRRHDKIDHQLAQGWDNRAMMHQIERKRRDKRLDDRL